MKEVHPTYRRVALNKEIAELNRSRSLIESRAEDDKLNAEISYLTSLSNLNDQLQSFYEDVVDAAFTVAMEDSDYDIAEIRHKIASDAYSRSRRQYQDGLVSAEDVEEKRIALEEAEKELLGAQETREDANRYFTYTTGQEWKAHITGLFSLFHWEPERDAWRQADFALRKTGLQADLAGLNIDNLPANHPQADRRMKEIALEQAVLAEEAAEFETDRMFARTLLDLKTERQSAEVLARKYELQEKQTADTRLRFEQGAVSEQEYDQQRVALLLAERNGLDALLDYITTLFDAVVASGLLPEDVLK